MKKMITIVLALTMMLALAACGGSEDADTTTAATTGATTVATIPEYTEEIVETEAATEEVIPEADPESLEGIINAIYEIQPVQFMTGNIGIDLTDTSEDGLWTLKAFTGLDNADLISQAWASEAMIGSIPYSMVLVRVTDAANAETVAEAMKNGIDTRKWICVEASDLKVTASGDVVMLIMLDGDAQSFVDAFATVMGGTDFVK